MNPFRDYFPKPVQTVRIGKVTVELYVQSHLGRLPADALLLPTNRLAWMGQAVGKRVRDEAGNRVEAEARQQAPLEPAGCAVTSGGLLPVKRIVHVNMLDAQHMCPPELLVRALSAGLDRCGAEGAAAVVIPDFTDQLVRFAARDAAVALGQALRQAPVGLRTVKVICADPARAIEWKTGLAETLAA